MQDKEQHNEQGQRHGHWEVYYSCGIIMREAFYINGEHIGYHYFNSSVYGITKEYYAK
jgi:antitoxin component YwqK of YwqJK toxin-antitoxin module